MLDANSLARQILEIVPPVMRTLSADIRGSSHLLSPAHFGVMVTLAYHPCNLSSLAEDQGVSLPTMSSTVSILAERGWVKRQRSTKDRRVVNIELTEAGFDQLLEIRSYAEKRLVAMLGSVGEKDIEALGAGLSVMRRLFEISDGQTNNDDCIE
jgi:DNA-binding MarR family transcriptional regulator